MEKVLVLGSINIDFVSFISRYPHTVETLTSNDFGIFQGGKGANQAIALAKLNVPALMLGKTGKDILSDFALSSLQEGGVDTTGAGDCFVAGFLRGMLQQEDIAQAIRIANLTASYSIQKKGAAISFPKKSEIDWKKLE